MQTTQNLIAARKLDLTTIAVAQRINPGDTLNLRGKTVTVISDNGAGPYCDGQRNYTLQEADGNRYCIWAVVR